MKWTSIAASFLGLALAAPAMAKDRVVELSDRNDNNPACRVYFTADLSRLNMHGQDFTMKWLESEGAKKWPSLCFTLNPMKASQTFVVTTSRLRTVQQVGVRTQTQTSTSTTNEDGTVNATVTGDVNANVSGNYSGTANTTTTSEVAVPYTYNVSSQMVYGYVGGQLVSSIPWSFNDGTGLVGGLTQKGMNNHHVHQLFEHMMNFMNRQPAN
jgi:hypothetical protein